MSSTTQITSYVTNKCGGYDFVHQYKYLIDILLICYANGYEFVYNKLTNTEYNYQNDPPEFVERMENLMNLRPYFTPFGDPSLNGAYIAIYDTTVKYIINSKVDYYTADEYMGRIRNMFWANKDSHTLFDNNGKTNVVVDINGSNHLGNIFAMNKLRNEYNTLSENGNLIFHIYTRDSNISMELSGYYSGEDTIIHINQNIESIFIHMVAADMLIIANSLFSYTAALLSNGIVYYHLHQQITEFAPREDTLTNSETSIRVNVSSTGQMEFINAINTNPPKKTWIPL
jgi:hypothetical protein